MRGAVEMPGLWKAWKAKDRLPTLPTSPLEISPQSRRDSHIPTAPAKPQGKVENQNQVSHFPLRLCDYDHELCRSKPAAGASPRRLKTQFNERSPQLPDTKSLKFRAHPALESKAVFRLISYWNQFSISGSFLDWKMLGLTRYK